MMSLTIGNFVFAGLVLLIGLGISVAALLDDDFKKFGIANIFITTIFLTILVLIACSWWHNNTASGERAYKDYTSNMSKGLEREITITAEDGREIFHYEGKIDVETKHDGNANYILFESEEGLRYIIYYGITDTVLIVQKGAN